MKRALIVLALAACERASHGVHVYAPDAKVGDRMTYHFRYDSHLTGPDGTEHAGHSQLSLITKVLEVSGGHAQRMQIFVDRADTVFDGKPRPELTGTYELTAAGEVTRADGKPPTDEEKAFFGSWHIGNDDHELAAREFHAGDKFRPSASEAISLGLPRSKTPWVLDVRRATDDEIVLTGEFVVPDSPANIEEHATTTITLNRNVHTHVDDIATSYQGKPVGGVHSTFELRFTR